MPKRVQDIVPIDKRGMREIRIHRASEAMEEPPRRKIARVAPADMRNPGRNGSKMKWVIITLAVILMIAGAGYVASTKFARATFTIVPKVVPITVSGNYVAYPAKTAAKGTLAYEVITMKGIASTTIPSTNGPTVSTKASGKVIMYNSFSAQPIRLIAGTRLSNAKGNIYRLTKTIVIPGYKQGASLIPGSISTTVTADQPGQSYNMSQTDSENLSIVAYKGSARYEKVYGKLSTDITGGFAGVKKITNPAHVSSSTAALKSELTESLLSEIKSKVPTGYIMYEGANSAVFSQPVIDGASKTSAVVTLSGTAYGIILPKIGLIQSIAGPQSASIFGNFAYTTPGLEDLKVVVTNIKDFVPDKPGTLVFQAKGKMALEGTIPVDEIKAKLAGIPLKNTEDVFKSYGPVIQSGSGELEPPWARIPSDLNRISIKVEKPRQ